MKIGSVSLSVQVFAPTLRGDLATPIVHDEVISILGASAGLRAVAKVVEIGWWRSL